MATRKISFAPGEYYHLYNRGNSKQTIFRDASDYRRFIHLLYISNTKNGFVINRIDSDIFAFERGERLVSIGAWVLMPNHFHLLITQNTEGGISKFMQKLTTAYSMYYNQKYKRTGGLFEGKFKSEHTDTDEYLKYLFSYIHLNPIKLIQKDWKEAGIKDKQRAFDFLKNYLYSSFTDYINNKTRPEGMIVDKKMFPDYFQTIENFKKEIFEWLSYKNSPSSVEARPLHL